MMTGAPNGTARIHECQENNEIYGHIQYSHTMNVSLPTSCDPTDLPLTHPLFFEWIASVGMTNPSYTWCEFFAMRDLTGLKDHCGPLEEGLVCNNKGSPVCFERLSSTQLKVYSCQ